MTKKISEIRIDGNVAYVALTKGYEAAIDAADVPIVDGFSWVARVVCDTDGAVRSVYAYRYTLMSNGRRTRVWMHRVIAATPEGMETDHRDGDGLNNRMSNLRAATKSQNQHNRRKDCNNTSGVKGVYWHRRARKWRSRIISNGVERHLGYYDSISDAAAAYAQASLVYHGEFGRTE